MRKTRLLKTLFILAFFTVSAASGAPDKSWKLPKDDTRLKPGPGSQLTTASCLLCHSADYVSTQPPLDRAAWKGIVTKMREKYGAPVQASYVDEIVAYLAENYGKPNGN
jgi:hypothetical protein